MRRTILLPIASLLAAAICLLSSGARQATAVEPPEPDLTGRWFGTFGTDPREVGEVAMLVDAQSRNQFKGRLQLGRLVFDIRGTVTVEPPTPDSQRHIAGVEPPSPDSKLHIVGVEPPTPDRTSAQIMVRGTIGLTEPPEPDRQAIQVIRADYLIVGVDGSRQFGSLYLVNNE